MNRQLFQKQWTAYLDGNAAAANDSMLAVALATETAWRENALRDAELHGLLLALGRVDSSEEAFVGAVVARLMNEEPEAAPLPTSEPPATLEPNACQRSRGHIPPPIPPPIQTWQVAPPVVATGDRGGHVSRHLRKQNTIRPVGKWHRWMACVCATALLVLLGWGLVFVFHADDQQVADRPVVDRRPPFAESGTRRQRVERPRTMPPVPEEPGKRAIADVTPAPAPFESSGPTPPSSNSTGARPRAAPDADNPPPLSAPPAQSVEAAVAFGRIVDDSDAEWESTSSPPLAGDLIRLRAGVVKIEMTEGAMLIVQSPADFALLSPRRISLSRGQVAATVPAAAAGFAVQTPSSQVVDLGTEFVVDVDDSGATAVQVLRGEVEVATGGRDKKDRQWRLAAGDYKWVSGDGERDFDWRLHLTVDDKSFRGELNVNGREFVFAKPAEFVSLYPRIVQELVQLRQFLLSAPARRAGEPFQAEISLNGQRSTISNLREYARIDRRVNDKLRQLWVKALQATSNPNGHAFSGSFNINGEEFGVNSGEDLRKLQAEIMRRATGETGPAADKRGEEKRRGGTRPDKPLSERTNKHDEPRRGSASRRRKSRSAVPSESVGSGTATVRDQGSADRIAVFLETKDLYGIHWHNSPADAVAAASVKNEKPVMWFRVLGDLSGFM